MAGLLIKNVPPELHERLRERAKANRRSVNQEALVLLEDAVRFETPRELPPPYKGSIFLTDEWIDSARREGRK